VRPEPLEGADTLEVCASSKTMDGPHAARVKLLDHRQALTAAQTAAPQNVAPARAAHPLQKAMLALARDALGLVRTLHRSELVLLAPPRPPTTKAETPGFQDREWRRKYTDGVAPPTSLPFHVKLGGPLCFP
jgi:hypothetical protein